MLFSPADSLIRRLFEHEESKEITIRPTPRTTWSTWLPRPYDDQGELVYFLAFSPDSARLASASCDKTIKIWDASSGACLQTLEGHGDLCNSVAFSPDLAWLASASDDRTIKIWDTSSGACIHTLKSDVFVVNSVAFSSDSARLASASADSTIKIWDASSGACIHTLEGHGSSVYSVAFSPDSATLASASRDKTFKIWDASSGACLETLNFYYDMLKGADDISQFALGHSDGGVTKTNQQVDRNAVIGLLGSWISKNGQKLLRLPREYLPWMTAVSGRCVGLGTREGRVWICQLSDIDC